ncbi:MAG: hypothetical protein QM724_05795 [Flavobacteriales bacterium]
MSKASCHCASFIGGRAPMMGFHSVMLRPLPVRRVMPPMATMQAIITQPVSSQVTTGFNEREGVPSIAARSYL